MQESQGAAGTGCGAAGRALPAIARGVATAGGVRCDLRQFSRDRRDDGTGFAVRARAARLLGYAIDGRARPRDPAVAPPVTFDEFKGVRLLAAHVHGGSLPHFTNKQVTNLEEVKGLQGRAPTRIGTKL